MTRRFRLLILYSLYWLIYFIFARFLFLLAQYKELSEHGLSSLLLTFYHGLRMDFSATGYLLLLPVLVSIPALFTGGKWFSRFLSVYTYVILTISTLVIVMDAGVYSYWGYRLEFSIVEYLKTPADAMASATTLQLVLFVGLTALVLYLFIKIFRIIREKYFSELEKVRYPLAGILATLLVWGFLVLPIRGGTGVAPLNTGSVYFTDNLFLNHTAINEMWNFGHTAAYRKAVKNPYLFHDKSVSSNDLGMLLNDDGETKHVLNTSQPDILLVILESFGSYLTETADADSAVTPRFRELKKEGIFFSNLYAAGSRTDKAIPAILSGYPNIPGILVLRDSKKTQSMPSIVRDLGSRGYNSSFWYGGDINFANLRSYLLTSGYIKLVTKDDFDPADCNSKWGVHDHILFERLGDSIKSFRSPFFCSVLTLSSHEPFEVPMQPVFKGKDELSKFRNSVYYADKSLGEFIDSAKKTSWWKNALVILIADHCRRYSEKVPTYSDDIFKIPMLWIGGAVSIRDTVIEKAASQFDLPLTLSHQLGLDGKYPFSKDLFSSGSKSFAFYTYNDGFSLITDSSKAIYDIKMKSSILETGKEPERARELGKSFLQCLFDDYLGR